MDILEILRQVDEFFAGNNGPAAEKLMLRSIEQAVAEQDDSALLQLLNELMGYYRESSQTDSSYAIAEQAIAQAQRMGLAGTVPYATTLLNAANAYRAGGSLNRSLELYRQVQQIYQRQTSPNSLLTASLYNNISLLFQEMGDFGQARENLLAALAIVEKREDADFETAVTCANLANTCLQAGESEEAFAYAGRAVELFEARGFTDSHYGAALSALGTYYYQKGDYRKGRDYFARAMAITEETLGRTQGYERLLENVKACEERMLEQGVSREAAVAGRGAAAEEEKDGAAERTGEQCADVSDAAVSPSRRSGMELSRAFYEKCVAPMIREKFPAYEGKIAAGLVGEGSECFGYDDMFSADHDFGPELCLWLDDETYAQIGEALQEAYDHLPREEFSEGASLRTGQARGRRGVRRISEFYESLVQASDYGEIPWGLVEDYALAAAANGAVFRDDAGIFGGMRKKLKAGYPENVRFRKLAESAARFAQAGQYNFGRMCGRGDFFTAALMGDDCIREAIRLQHYLENRFPPHDKWLRRSLEESEAGRALAGMLVELQKLCAGAETSRRQAEALVEKIAVFLTCELYGEGLISDSDPFLGAHTEELLVKASLSERYDTVEALAEAAARMEFEAFDKVQNEGGRADCQNDWPTFSVMRRSQYLTWSRRMLLQYLYDFQREYERGHNLITEKYGRMMESTAPERYEELREHFPALTEEKKAIIEQIVQLQVAWMEEFAARYPHLAANARSIHTSEDGAYNTSYETYLRGEISTYSDKMLELYGRYVVSYARSGENLTFAIMENSVKLYGYSDMDAAERFLGL